MHKITSLARREVIDLSTLSVADMYRLHYEEECYIADAIKRESPFSEERKMLLHTGGIVRGIMISRHFSHAVVLYARN